MPHPAVDGAPSSTQCKTDIAVVLCSRGYSFEDRLQEVTNYARHNGIGHVLVLHCPEKKYSDAYVAEIAGRADRLFSRMEQHLTQRDAPDIRFELISKQGRLEDNLSALIAERNIRMVFVGMKMLDYRPDAIKKLRSTAFYFLGN